MIFLENSKGQAIPFQQLLLLQKVIDFIDDHLKEEIDPEELAKMAGYSPFHFYRIFHKQIGYTVMDYVLKRKLQHALYELVSGKKIIEIALEYGFDTHAGFTKAFKRCFGSPPSLYKLHCPISPPQKLNLVDLYEKNLGGIVLQPMIVSRPSFWVAGKTFKSSVKNVSYTRDAPAFWDQEGLNDGSVERALYAALAPKKHGEYCINLTEEDNDEEFTYLFAVDLDEQVKPSNEFLPFKIPASTYAIFKTPAVEKEQFVSAIKGTWRYILEDWLPHSSYEVDEKGYDFEYYDEYCHYWNYEKIYMEIHLPIKEKSRG
ncbi:AraC family transcriptional regulator [Bacillus sp. S/N-304-OC-R1]|uniref:AraC family transcriptional regulator n=1 Tax=Bacillus sp. S/N-304-OC-R1 TaxID=2758034 RepID=UPI001C8EA682|nr:AraC family transcriptional regulator [Bacillus sp. S/N-304-OC-R1]MBY0123056.1 AraC family transcriptional regulator [Bacillus sp. S/N-304-OC-R1]